MLQVVRFVAAFCWTVGLVLFLFGLILPGLWVLAFPVLFVAIIASIFSMIKTRDIRHEELLEASKATPAPSSTPPQARDAADRLRQLDSLRDSGAITETEYKQKRQQILDDL